MFLSTILKKYRYVQPYLRSSSCATHATTADVPHPERYRSPPSSTPRSRPPYLIHQPHALITITTRYAPLDAERTQDVDTVVPVRRAVRVARVPLERGELGARARDGLHLRELQRAEVPVERVHRVPVCVAGDGRRDQLRGNFLQREGFRQASVLNYK